MSDALRRWLFRIGTLLVGGLLLYFALRGVDFDGLGEAMRRGRYGWAIPLVVITLFSHVLRAERWRLLLRALPAGEETSEPRTRTAFSSLMIGYMVNYVAPRVGEVVRTTHMSLRTRLSIGGVFGTVVAERLLDALSLFVFLLTLPLVLGRRTPDLISIVSRPVDDLLQNRGIELIVVAVLAVGVTAAGIYLLFLKPTGADDHSRLFRALEAFRHGIFTLARSRSTVAISVLTLSMWACYVAMAYLPMVIFGFGGADGLGLWDVWAVMLIGSVGIAIPSPGGVGSYHFLTIQALVLIWGIPQETAASYAIFTHGGQMILYIVMGVAIVIVEGISWSELKSAGRRGAAAVGMADPPN